MPLRRKFTEWLNFHPTTDEIARALASEYLSEFSVRGVRFGQVNFDDSIQVIGQFGYADAELYRDRVIPSAEWRAVDAPDVNIIKNGHKESWSPCGRFFVSALRDRGVTHGYLIIEFNSATSRDVQARIIELVDFFAATISLYLSFQNRGAHSMPPGTVILNDSRDSGAGQLSARQLSILRGMVEGKTNHELATEMGFSVSTIRHETMRIYQALAVSDRKEAAKKALMLGLI
jgi:DNA-binding CsgD family transcriptional regulator